jgi:alpha-beta hydrolase superfamily lysophospholipase
MMTAVTAKCDWATGQGPIKNLGLPGETFLIGDRPAFILWPDSAKRRQPQPWVMYAPTLPGYPDVHEKWMHQKFLDAGIAVAGIDMGEAYGSPAGNDGMTSLYDYLVTERQFKARPCLLGRSRGGLWVSSWAIRHPDKVAGIIGIYPVFDLTTYPGLAQAAPAYGLTPTALSDQLAEWNPIARADVLAKAKIPMAIIHGDVDTVVPLEQNSQTMARIYRESGVASEMFLEVVSGQGHNHWQGFFRSQSLVDHAIRWATRN